jgi:hypothetical protein
MPTGKEQSWDAQIQKLPTTFHLTVAALLLNFIEGTGFSMLFHFARLLDSDAAQCQLAKDFMNFGVSKCLPPIFGLAQPWNSICIPRFSHSKDPPPNLAQA